LALQAARPKHLAGTLVMNVAVEEEILSLEELTILKNA
jgi:hypothetical protein